tara:strand:+ start:455 stop:739 length:285 start_codon:yes stop_codon:yes gene_type:complete
MGNKQGAIKQQIKDALGDIEDHQNYPNKPYNYGDHSHWKRKKGGDEIIRELKEVQELLEGLKNPTEDELKRVWERWKTLKHEIDYNYNNVSYRF